MTDHNIKTDLTKFTKSTFRKWHILKWKLVFTNTELVKKEIAQVRFFTQRILFNEIYLTKITENEQKQAILHEVAHVCVGTGGHTKEFRRICDEIGCTQKTSILK